MFKMSGSPIITGTIVSALHAATGPPAAALDRWIELTNNTRMPIVEVYISPVRSGLWNIDLLGEDYLAPAVCLVEHNGAVLAFKKVLTFIGLVDDQAGRDDRDAKWTARDVFWSACLDDVALGIDPHFLH